MGVAESVTKIFMMGCFESRRRKVGAGAEREQPYQGGEPLDQSEVKISEHETVRYNPDKDKKLTMSMVSSKDRRYWDFEFKGT